MTRITRDAFLYLDGHSDDFAQCGTCVFGHDHCAIMGGGKVSAKRGSCGYYILAGTAHTVGHPIAHLTREQTGYVERRVRCENCQYYSNTSTCRLFERLNKRFPDIFDLDPQVRMQGCCNAQVPH